MNFYFKICIHSFKRVLFMNASSYIHDVSNVTENRPYMRFSGSVSVWELFSGNDVAQHSFPRRKELGSIACVCCNNVLPVRGRRVLLHVVTQPHIVTREPIHQAHHSSRRRRRRHSRYICALVGRLVKLFYFVMFMTILIY